MINKTSNEHQNICQCDNFVSWPMLLSMANTEFQLQLQ